MPVNIRQLIAKAPTKQVRAWMRVLGPPFIALTVVLTALGTAIAFSEGYFNLVLFLSVMLAAFCIHFGASCLNDYFDHLGGSDNVNVAVTPYSGGSRVIQENLLKPRTLLRASIYLFSVGAIIGVLLSILRGWPILILGMIGMFLAVGYVEPHINLCAKGLGEIAVFLGFGPLLVYGSYYVQARRFDNTPLFAGIIMGILAASVLWINEIPDFEADISVDKKNLVVRLGKKRAARVFMALLPLAYMLIIFGLMFKLLPWRSVLVFLTLPIAYKAAGIAHKYYDDVYKLLPANALTIALIIVFGAILSISFIWR